MRPRNTLLSRCNLPNGAIAVRKAVIVLTPIINEMHYLAEMAATLCYICQICVTINSYYCIILWSIQYL